MYLVTILLMWFATSVLPPLEEESLPPQSSIIQKVEPGLVGALNQTEATPED